MMENVRIDLKEEQSFKGIFAPSKETKKEKKIEFDSEVLIPI